MNKSAGKRSKQSTDPLHPWIANGWLVVEFKAMREKWALPNRANKTGIGQVRRKSEAWAHALGATDGQARHIWKVLTADRYYVMKNR